MLRANEEPVVKAAEGTRRLDVEVERATFKWLRLGDGPGEDMMTRDREALMITMIVVIVRASNTMLDSRQIEDQIDM